MLHSLSESCTHSNTFDLPNHSFSSPSPPPAIDLTQDSIFPYIIVSACSCLTTGIVSPVEEATHKSHPIHQRPVIRYIELACDYVCRRAFTCTGGRRTFRQLLIMCQRISLAMIVLWVSLYFWGWNHRSLARLVNPDLSATHMQRYTHKARISRSYPSVCESGQNRRTRGFRSQNT